MADITVKDANGTNVVLRAPNANGRAAASASEPVALSTEDLAAINAITTAIGGISAGGSSGGDASAANQDEQTALLTNIDATLTAAEYFPATQPVSGTVSVSGTVPVSGTFFPATQPVSGNVGISGSVAVTGTFFQATQPVSAASLPLPSGAATSAKQDAVIAAFAALLSDATFQARIPTLGTKTASGSVSTTPSSDQDPIYDHANAVKATVTGTSSTVITPPAGCKYMRVHASVDMFLRTDGTAAADAAGSIKILANQPETIPVTAATAVTAINAGTLYATPLKVR